jgi:sodium/hydrogen antiporter
MIGSDDVLACFIAGNTFTWDDWFRKETLDDSLQPTIDMLLNVAVFLWFGAVCPWYSFAHNSQIPIYRLIFLGILVLLLRRPPIVLAMHTKIHQIEEWRQALFVGYFGPIGVSAIFYLYVSLEYLRTSIDVDGKEREDAIRLGEVMNVVVWFLVVCSIIVHGLSIPLGKLGFYLPRTISIAISQDTVDRSFRVSESPTTASNNQSFPRPVYRIGRSAIKSQKSIPHPNSKATSNRDTPQDWLTGSPTSGSSAGPASPTIERTINFPQQTPDELEESRREGLSDEQMRKIENPNPSIQGHLGHLHSGRESTRQNSPARSRTSIESTRTTLRTPVGLGTRNIKFPDEEEV